MEPGERLPDARPSQLPHRPPARPRSAGARRAEDLLLAGAVVFLVVLGTGELLWPSLLWPVLLGLAMIGVYGMIARFEWRQWRRARRERRTV